jgi:hypothetical protein
MADMRKLCVLLWVGLLSLCNKIEPSYTAGVWGQVKYRERR